MQTVVNVSKEEAVSFEEVQEILKDLTYEEKLAAIAYAQTVKAFPGLPEKSRVEMITVTREIISQLKGKSAEALYNSMIERFTQIACAG